MFKPVSTFSGFSVNNQAQAKDFYVDTLGLELASDAMGLNITLPGGAKLFIYEKPDHQPATFTVLNFVVDNIDEALAGLQDKGVTFEHYDMGDMKQDEKGILRGRSANMGPDIAWFKDPSGNVLAILQN